MERTIPKYKETESFLKEHSNEEVVKQIVQLEKPCRVEVWNPTTAEVSGVVQSTPKILLLNKMHQEDFLVQGEQAWHVRRNFSITASTVHDIIHVPKRVKYTMARKKLMCKKIGIFKEDPIENECVWHGKAFEEIAIKMYEKITKEKVLHFGAMKSLHPGEDHFLASPDGITTNEILVEVKCPYVRTPKGEPPVHYMDQIQFMLYIWDLDLCHYVEFIPAKHNPDRKGIFATLSPSEDMIADAEMFDYEDPNHQIDIILVRRDPEWIVRNKPVLDEFWRDYLELRNRPDLLALGPDHEDQDERISLRSSKRKRTTSVVTNLVTIDQIDHPDWSAPFCADEMIGISASALVLKPTKEEDEYVDEDTDVNFIPV